ncbi:MAG: hypothetical protein AB7I30_05340 [Isosphaeraceae bacterium]
MADADWWRYKQVRGEPLPESAELLGARYRLERVLKRDFYAAVGVYVRDEPADGEGDPSPARVLYKVYHTDGVGLNAPPWRWLGRMLRNREAHYFTLLDGIPGVPRLWAVQGESALVREYVPGRNLREFVRDGQTPDAAYFPRLRQTLDAVHARGVSHNDLSKPENLLVTDEGAPVLIDFQIAARTIGQGWPVLGRLSRAVIRYVQRVDRYHLAKQHRRRRPDEFDAKERENLRRKGLLLSLHGRFVRRPYRAVRHVVLDRYLTRADGPTAPAAPHVGLAPETSAQRETGVGQGR